MWLIKVIITKLWAIIFKNRFASLKKKIFSFVNYMSMNFDKYLAYVAAQNKQHSVHSDKMI